MPLLAFCRVCRYTAAVIWWQTAVTAVMSGTMAALINVIANRKKTTAETEKFRAEEDKFHAEAEKIRADVKAAAHQSQTAIKALDEKVSETVDSLSGLAAQVGRQLHSEISEEALDVLRVVAREAAYSQGNAVSDAALAAQCAKVLPGRDIALDACAGNPGRRRVEAAEQC